MQSTGQTSTHAESFVPMHGSQMIYATLSPERSFLQRASITCLFLLLGAGAVAQPPNGWQEAPEFVRLFAPPAPRAAAYRAYVSPLDLQAALRAITADPAMLHPPGSWDPQPVLAADAFGQSGSYDRFALARLYGARRPLVARGPRADGGQVVEAWTLISPYPDAELQRLQAGTLLIVVRLP
jgi:hypothetical protein